MRLNQVGNRPDHVIVNVQNVDTVNIPYGTPLILKFTLTASPLAAPIVDGMGVVLPATATAATINGLFYGVALDNTNTFAANTIRESQVVGLCPYALLTVMTRSASTASWTSSASIAAGVLMSIDTVNNAFAIGASLAASNFLPFAVLAQSVSSNAASASATSDTRVVITQGVRVFLRAL